MKTEQIRQALGELNGERDVTFAFTEGTDPVTVHRAMLVPVEEDALVKLTDGQSIFILDAERVAWVRIGLNGSISS